MHSQTEQISRLQFLRKLGFSGASLMAVYCGVTMSSCVNESDLSPSGSGGSPTYDMGSAAYARLLSKGGYYVDTANNLVIANTSDHGFVAVTLVCTHEGKKQISYTTDKFTCSAHGATFDNTGKATGVASKALTVYPVTQVGNILTVSL